MLRTPVTPAASSARGQVKASSEAGAPSCLSSLTASRFQSRRRFYNTSSRPQHIVEALAATKTWVGSLRLQRRPCSSRHNPAARSPLARAAALKCRGCRADFRGQGSARPGHRVADISCRTHAQMRGVAATIGALAKLVCPRQTTPRAKRVTP